MYRNSPEDIDRGIEGGIEEDINDGIEEIHEKPWYYDPITNVSILLYLYVIIVLIVNSMYVYECPLEFDLVIKKGEYMCVGNYTLGQVQVHSNIIRMILYSFGFTMVIVGFGYLIQHRISRNARKI